MDIIQRTTTASGEQFSVTSASGMEVADAHLYILFDDDRTPPFGLLKIRIREEVSDRNTLITTVIEHVMAYAREIGCRSVFAMGHNACAAFRRLYQLHGVKAHLIEMRLSTPPT